MAGQGVLLADDRCVQLNGLKRELRHTRLGSGQSNQTEDRSPSYQTASRRSPCERSPRTAAGLVPGPWLISIAGLVKVGAVGCCAATDVLAVSRPLESGATNVRAATDSCATGRSSNENTVAAPAVAPMIADRRFAL